MFWSKTKEIVHAFTEKRSCYVTLEDTLLGFLLDNLTWCGKSGSQGTLTLTLQLLLLIIINSCWTKTTQVVKQVLLAVCVCVCVAILFACFFQKPLPQDAQAGQIVWTILCAHSGSKLQQQWVLLACSLTGSLFLFSSVGESVLSTPYITAEQTRHWIIP